MKIVKNKWGWLVLALLPTLTAQWMVGIGRGNPDTLVYDEHIFTSDYAWGRVERFPAVVRAIGYGNPNLEITVDSIHYVITPYPEVTKKIAANPKARVFGVAGRSIYLPEHCIGKTVRVFAPRKIFLFFSCPFWALCILLCGIILNVPAMRRETSEHRKKIVDFWLRSLLWGMSLVLATAAWTSGNDVVITNDGVTYLGMASSENILQNAFYNIRTPGYPLFLVFAKWFSPLNLNMLIFWQYLIFLSAFVWLLLELRRLGLPVWIVLVIYGVFYDYMSSFHDKVLCESLELAGIAGLAAAGLWCARVVLSGKRFATASAIALTGALCFCNVMVKPLPGIMLLAPGMMFVILLGRLPWKNIFWVSSILGMWCVLPSLGYCTLRWQNCGDFNFASLVHALSGAMNLTLSTEGSLQNPAVTSENRDLAKAIIAYQKQSNSAVDWPACDLESTRIQFQRARLKFLYSPGVYGFFGREFNEASSEVKSRYKTIYVYTNERCRSLAGIADPRLIDRMGKFYLQDARTLFWKPRWVGWGLETINPFVSKSRLLLGVFLPWGLLGAGLLWLRKRGYCMKKGVPFLPLASGIVLFMLLPTGTLILQNLFLKIFVFESRTEMLMLWSCFCGTILLGLYGWHCLVVMLIKIVLQYRERRRREKPSELSVI